MASGDRFVSAFLSAFDIARGFRRDLSYSGAALSVLTENFCHAPQSSIIVGTDGRLTACYEVFDPSLELGAQFFFGRIAEGVLHIDETARRSLLNKVRQRRMLCRGCFCYWHCAGDCPAATFSPDGAGHLRFGPRCEINRGVTKGLLVRFIQEGGGVWRGQ
jgi:radical SAM protein with 4Fe4S-binding SPASM domain